MLDQNEQQVRATIDAKTKPYREQELVWLQKKQHVAVCYHHSITPS